MNDNSFYLDSVSKKKVALLGIMPPPFGGVSVHIERAIDQLAAQRNTIFFWPTEQRMRRWGLPLYFLRLMRWLIGKRPDVLYYHSSYLSTGHLELGFLLMMRMILRYRLVIVDHDCRHLYRRPKRYKKWYRWIASRVDRIVCIGQSTYQSYIDAGIVHNYITNESAFIPPAAHRAEAIQAAYPSSLHIFLQEHTPLFLMSAAHIMTIDGNDLYGIDTAITVLSEIKLQYPDAGLVIGLPTIGDQKKFVRLRESMQEHNVSEQIYFLQGNKELWPLFNQVDLFLRPTLSDGDSISVREALYFNVPVIASDAVTRPDGVQTYRTSDITHFVAQVLTVLQEQVYGTLHKRNHMYTQSRERSR